jgi:hypothetical protein
MIPAYVAQYEAMKPLSWWVEPQRLIYAPAPAPDYACDEMDTLPVEDVIDMLGGRGPAESSDEAGRSLAESSDEAEPAESSDEPAESSDEPAESSDEAEPAEDEPAESSDEAGFSEEVKAAAMVAVIAAIEGDAAGFAAAAKQQHAGRSVGAAAILAASAAKYGGFEAAVKIVSKYLEGATAE